MEEFIGSTKNIIMNWAFNPRQTMFGLPIIVIALSFLSLSVPKVSAAVRCETQYGGGQVCVTTGKLQINKKVCTPVNGTCDDDKNPNFTDNLGITAPKFSPQANVIFQLEIKNVGDATFDKVTVTDTLPSFIEAVDPLQFDLTNLKPGQSETRTIHAKVVSADKLPTDKSLVCVVNSAQAQSGSESDRDTAQLCIEKRPVAPVKQLPKAGMEGWVIPMFVSFIIGGLLLNRRFKVAENGK